MLEEILHRYHEVWLHFQNGLINNAPRYITAVLFLFIGLAVIKYAKKWVQKYIHSRSKDTLAADFLVNLVGSVFLILLILSVMGILGWNSFTDKILAAAGISTFVIGFALKDIGENFLAGIIMAFRRPFRIGDLIEVSGIMGRVQRLSLRDTSLKTLDGKDVFIPNGLILKNPLQNFTHDHYMRSEFSITLDYSENIQEAIDLITQVINSFDDVVNKDQAHAVISEISTSSVKISARFWFATDNVSAPGMKLKTQVMLKVMSALKEAGFNHTSASTHVVIDTEKPQSKDKAESINTSEE